MISIYSAHKISHVGDDVIFGGAPNAIKENNAFHAADPIMTIGVSSLGLMRSANNIEYNRQRNKSQPHNRKSQQAKWI